MKDVQGIFQHVSINGVGNVAQGQMGGSEGDTHLLAGQHHHNTAGIGGLREQLGVA